MLTGDDYAKRLLRHLQPDATRRLLTLAGLYLLAYELVKDAVVEDVRRFFSWDLDDDKAPLVADDYVREVRAGGAKAEFEGSVDWLVEHGALEEACRGDLWVLRDERNRVAHQILGLVVDPHFNLDVEPLLRAAEVLRFIGLFFGRIHASCDPAFDGVELTPDNVESGKSVVYSIVLERVQDLLLE